MNENAAGSLTHAVAAALGGLLVGGLLLAVSGASTATAPLPPPPPPDPFPKEAEALTQQLRDALWTTRLPQASKTLDAIEDRARRELLSNAPNAIAHRRVETFLATAEHEVDAYLAEQKKSARIDVNVNDADLVDVMDKIGRQIGATILVDPNVQEQVSVSLREIQWREAVDVIAKMTRCEVEHRNGGILLLTQPPKVTIQFTDANVRTVLQLLGAYSGKNLVITPDVKGNITLDLKNMHWLTALQAIARSHKLQVYRIGQDLAVVSGKRLGHVKKLAPPPPPPAKRLTERIKALQTRLAVGRVTLTLEAEASEVVERIEAQAGQPLGIDPDLGGKTVRLRVHRVPWKTALEAVARQIEGRLETTPKGRTRIVLGSAGTRLTAYGAPAKAWFELLTLLGERPVRVDRSARTRRVNVDLRDLAPVDAARASAIAIGCELRKLENAHEVRPLGDDPSKPIAPRRVTVVDPQGGKLKLTYQGSAITPNHRMALLNGVIQREGEKVLRADGGRAQLKLIEVQPAGVLLQQVGGKGEKYHLHGVPQ